MIGDRRTRQVESRQFEARTNSVKSKRLRQSNPKQGDAGESVQARARNDAAGIPWDHRCGYIVVYRVRRGESVLGMNVKGRERKRVEGENTEKESGQ